MFGFWRKKKLVIVRIDAIGDYVLFRNFLESVKKAYRNYHVTLIGNIEYKELAEYFDNKFVDEFIWINKYYYCCDKKYIKKFNRQLLMHNFDLLISPVYSRDNWTLEPLVSTINARKKIGFWGDLANISYENLVKTNSNYTRLIQSNNQSCFEFTRNKEFFEKLLDRGLNIQKPYFDLDKNIKYEFTKKKFAVIFPGAGKPFREWSVEKYNEVVNFIINELDLKVLLIGSEHDVEKCTQIEKLINSEKSEKVENYAGKLKLYELPYVFKDAEFVLSSDTCAYHLSVAVNTKTFCISNGNTFCRFVPYPKNVYNDVYYAFPPEIESNLDNFIELTSKYINGSDLDINKIEPGKVIELIKSNYGGCK